MLFGFLSVRTGASFPDQLYFAKVRYRNILMNISQQAEIGLSCSRQLIRKKPATYLMQAYSYLTQILL
jgi:hypothetical protein